MTPIMDGLHRLGIAMDAKRVGIEGSLYAVFVQDPQDAPDTRPAAVIVLACRAAIVKRDDIVFLDRIRPADMMCPSMLGIRNLRPRFQIPCQSNRHPSIIRPLDFDLLRLRINVIKIIVRRHHGSLNLLRRFCLPLGYRGNPKSVSINGVAGYVDATSAPNRVMWLRWDSALLRKKNPHQRADIRQRYHALLHRE